MDKLIDFSNLNDKQLQAVEAVEGAVLVLAGAGTGKTKTLTSRIAYILANGLTYPNRILSVTFTNKAAAEMREKITDMVGDASAGLWLGTFHSICLRILRQHADKLGYQKDFSILDADDQLRLVKQIMQDSNFDIKEDPPKLVADIIGSWKDKALLPEKAQKNGAHGRFLKIYKIYQSRMKQMGVMDFNDLILLCIELFQNHPEVLTQYHERFDYILVDEYQDTNIAQYLWLRLLASAKKNICCVGDDDQSIYGWRGAEVGNILKFEQDFEGAQVIRLEQNYRSTPEILAIAAALIANNSQRLGKTLFSQLDRGDKVKVVSLWNDKEEAGYIADEITARQSLRNESLDEMAILVRAGYQTRAFEEKFLAQNIPYKIIGGLRFYERMEIRDAIAYIRVTMQPNNDLALGRIINTPKRGLGKKTIDDLRAFANENNLPLIEAIKHQIKNNLLKARPALVLSKLVNQFEGWKNLFSQSIDHAQVVDIILQESGYLNMWREDKSPEAQGRLENLKELKSALGEFADIHEFLEHVSLISDSDAINNDAMVSVMTMHASKGLEFETVFLTGWEEGLFPSERSMNESGTAGLEEERRLAYVGVTRAKRNLYISFVSSRYVYGQTINCVPSRFIDELPAEYIENVNNGLSYTPKRAASAGGFGEKKYNNYQKPTKQYAPKQSKGGLFNLNQRVFHQKFGYGKVIEINGENLRISFEKGSTRMLKQDYLAS